MNDECTIDMLIQKILTDDKQYDLSKIITAYEFAAKAHEGQTRSSGQPYIIHPLAVSYILLGLGMDTDTICAAMLQQHHEALRHILYQYPFCSDSEWILIQYVPQCFMMLLKIHL